MADMRLELKKLLESLGESSRFVSAGALPPVLPGLEFEKIGPVGIPISAEEARKLIGVAAQAPYGRGEETIVDTEVRRVWQIEPSCFRLENTEWHSHISKIVEAVRDDFGITQKVKADLYKLLIYEKGSFFAPHRDTEKTQNMFATLVVCLPSRHEGGTLVVRHDGQTKRIDFAAPEGLYKTQYAAFYADCEHEIEPVTAGYRVCLVYNLATAGRAQPQAPKNAPAAEQAAEWLRALFSDRPVGMDKLAIPLKHQYSEAGIHPQHLKGADRAYADVLQRAADSLGYVCHLALLTHWQSGMPDYSTIDFDPYARRGSYRRRRRGWYEEEEEEEEEEIEDGSDVESQAEMEEVFDEDLSLDHWMNLHGENAGFGEIHLSDDEILTSESRQGWSCRSQVHEATGNEGATLERCYRQAAIIVWPAANTFRILAGEGQGVALPQLEKRVASAKSEDEREKCRRFAAEIITHWLPRAKRLASQEPYSMRFLIVLQKLEAADLAERFVGEVLTKDFDGSEGKSLVWLGEQIGCDRLAELLAHLVKQQKPEDYFSKLRPIVLLCRAVCCSSPPLKAEQRAAFSPVTEALIAAVERYDKKRLSHYGENEPRAGVIDGMVHFLSLLSTQEQIDAFLDRTLADQQRYDLREALIPDVKAIYRWLPDVPQAEPAARRLLMHCQAELQAATAEPVQPPQDWAREAKLDCKCEDCQALARFLRDPAARVGRFPMRKDRRQHLHQQIETHHCDCTHETERKGSPQTLVCTKTQASYERRQRQYELDLKLLGALNDLASGTIPQNKTDKRRGAKRTKSK